MPDREASVVFIEPGGAYFAATLFGCVLLAAAAVLLIGHRLRAVPASQLGLGLGTLGVISLLLWRAFFLDAFYAVEAVGQDLRLHYVLPHRSKSLPRADVARVRIVAGGKSSVRILIETVEGQRIESAQLGRSSADIERARLEAALKVKLRSLGQKPDRR